MKAKLITLLSSAVLLASTSQAAIVLMDQSFTEATGNQPSIDGTAVGNANTAAGVASTWTAGAAAQGVLRTDGQVFSNLTGSAYVNLGSIVHNAKGNANGVFTLTTEMNFPSAGTNNWVSTGFFQAAATNSNFTSAGGLGHILYRHTGNLDFFAGPNTGGPSFTDIAPPVSDPQTLITVLDVSSWDGTSDFGTISFYTGSVAPANLQQTYNYLSGDGVDFTTIAAGISAASRGGEGVIQSISLTQVPEPSTYAIWAGLMTLGLVLYRRRGIQ